MDNTPEDYMMNFTELAKMPASTLHVGTILLKSFAAKELGVTVDELSREIEAEMQALTHSQAAALKAHISLQKLKKAMPDKPLEFQNIARRAFYLN